MNIIPDNEVWLPIVGYEAWYEVSSLGRIRRIKAGYGATKERGRVLKPTKNERGYLQINLNKQGKRVTRKLHFLVASAFLGERPNGYEINHKDANKENNHLDNLEYCTHTENMRHAFQRNLRKHARGEQNGMSKLTKQQVREIRELAKTMMQKDIAQIYGVVPSVIQSIVSNRTWKHL